MPNQKGLSPIVIFLVIAAIVLAAATGIYFWRQNKANAPFASTNTFVYPGAKISFVSSTTVSYETYAGLDAVKAYYTKALTDNNWSKVAELRKEDMTLCGGDWGGTYQKGDKKFKLHACGFGGLGFITHIMFFFYNISPEEILGSNFDSQYHAATSTLANSTINTTNWKTYRNGKYGFEFKYPADYVASDVDPTSVMDATDTLLAVVAIDEPYSEPFTYKVEVYSNKDSLILDKWFEIYKLESIYQNPDLIASQSRLGGYNAKQWESNSATTLGTFALKDNLVFSLEWFGYSSSDTRNIQIYQNILSTFKFTK